MLKKEMQQVVGGQQKQKSHRHDCHLQMLKPTQVKTSGSSMQGYQSPMSSQILRIAGRG